MYVCVREREREKESPLTGEMRNNIMNFWQRIPKDLSHLPPLVWPSVGMGMRHITPSLPHSHSLLTVTTGLLCHTVLTALIGNQQGLILFLSNHCSGWSYILFTLISLEQGQEFRIILSHGLGGREGGREGEREGGGREGGREGEREGGGREGGREGEREGGGREGKRGRR